MRDFDRPLGPLPKSTYEGAIRSEERSRIARELHDSTSQILVALQLQLGRLKRINRAGAEPLIVECERAIREIREQIRALGID